MHLTVRGKVPNVDAATFDRVAQATKEGCPVSQVFKGNVPLTLEAKLD
jgi:osmotically inducible protein OsmC